ncbi:syntaxin-18-like isoform X2 [Hydractinia symbiolongicarpus]|uniref:syntaxin-18-like isoform X2 n=1 Tax=Hydractinia symbiolongicarpus TaxID=13093 RepID=UPI002551AED1|nr:syntaxin-18-like isoform X2 [Hydractinia symbiolongicarpus]
MVRNITKLREFLLSHQLEYIGEFSHLISISSKLSSEERDQIDADAQTYIKSCSNSIFALKNEVNQISSESQLKSHCVAVIELLELYLKDVCKLYSQQRAYRVKQTLDRKRMSRLKPVRRKIEKKDSAVETKRTETIKKVDHKNKKKSNPVNSASKRETSTQQALLLNEEKKKEEFNFTPEETQMFEEENEQLYEEMNHVDKEIKNIEGKVIEIGQLQEIFQEKVLAQSTQIENLHETAVSTTENVKEGNEQIREAIKNSATFRVWILFFLVMCTFSLLFLDWYNV